MESQDLDRIRFVTRHYGLLKGLQILVPIGSLYLGMGLCSLLPQPASLITLIALAPVLIAGQVALQRYSSRYYPKRFGEVQTTRNQGALVISLLAVLILLPLGYVWFQGVRVGDRFLYLTMGSLLLFQWMWKECRVSQVYDLILGALLVGIAMPIHSPTGFLWPQLSKSGMSYLLVGGAMTLAGLLDHWQLLRALGPRQGEDLAEEAV